MIWMFFFNVCGFFGFFFVVMILLALAPMDGFTDCVYRAIAYEIRKQYGFHSQTQYQTRTEFMNADGYLKMPIRLIHHLVSVRDYPPPIVQIYGGKRETLVQACHDICKKYPFFAGIELNIGCPSPSVMQCEAGAGMMKNKAKTLQTVKDMSAACAQYGMKFSIKTRLGLTEADKPEQEQFIIDAIPFCSLISVHARTFTEGHSGDVDRYTLYKLKERYGKNIRLIGNGGISSYDDAMKKCGNLDGIMIAQSAIGNPRIFTSYDPTPQDRFETIIRHFILFVGWEAYMNTQKSILTDSDGGIFSMPTIADLIQSAGDLLYEKNRKVHSVREFRKHCFAYLKTLPGSKECKVALASTTTPPEVGKCLYQYFASIGCTWPDCYPQWRI